MKKAVYRPERSHDVSIENFIKQRVLKAVRENQDWIHFNCGMTGTGKTSLSFWMYEDFDPEHMTIDAIGLNRRDYAICMKRASGHHGLRFVMWDEADVGKRDALSRFNKDAMNMNWAIRGKEIFQIWNNPSAEWLDKPFIEEKINSFSYVMDKFKDRPRRYLFFLREDLLRLLNDKGDLKYETLRKHGPQYAIYRGWFRAYNGPLWKEYMKKKEARMDDKIDEFFQTYGAEESYTQVKTAALLGVTTRQLFNWRKEGVAPDSVRYSRKDVLDIAEKTGRKVSF